MITRFSGMHTPVKPQVQFQGIGGSAPIRRAVASVGLAAAAALGGHAAVVAEGTAPKVEEGLVATVLALASGRWLASTTQVGAAGFDKGLKKVAAAGGMTAAGAIALKEGMSIADASLQQQVFKGALIGADMPMAYVSAKGLVKDTKAAEGLEEFWNKVTRFWDKRDASRVANRESSQRVRAAKNEAATRAKEAERGRAGGSSGDGETIQMDYDAD